MAGNDTRKGGLDQFDRKQRHSTDGDLGANASTLAERPSLVASSDDVRRRLFEMIRRNEAARKAETR